MALPLVASPWPFEEEGHRYAWTECSSRMTASCADLPPGRLVHTTNFTLLSAMSAIEVMDAKMDGGMQRRTELSLARMVDDGELSVVDVPLPLCIATMDATLATMCTWMEGESMANTVYTNYYMNWHEDMPPIQHNPMRVFVLAAQKLVAVCCDVVEQAIVYDEEDYQGEHVLPFTPYAAHFSVAHILAECETVVKSAQIHPAVGCRVKLISTLLNVICKLLGVRDDVRTGVHSSRKMAPPTHPVAPSVLEADRLLGECQVLLTEVVATRHLALHHDSKCSDDWDPSILSLPSFAEHMHHVATAFPRAASIYSVDYSIAYWRNVCNRLQLLCVTMPQYNTFDTALFFSRQFSRKGARLISRSLLQLIYLPLIPVNTPVDPSRCACGADTLVASHSTACPCHRPPATALARVMGAETTLASAVFDSIKRFIYLPQLANMSYPLVDELSLSEFVGESTRVCLTMLASTGRNRARQRDCYATDVFPALDTLMTQSERMSGDNAVSNVCTRWALHHTLLSIGEWFELGFELKLFAAHELVYVYWYMGDIVFRWLRNIVGQAIDKSLSGLRLVEADAKARRKARHKREMERLRMTYTRHEQTMYWQAMYQCASAMFYTCLAAQEMQLLRVPLPLDVGLRYEHRLHALASISTPDYVAYEQYVRASKLHYLSAAGVPHIIGRAMDAFAECRTTLSNMSTMPAYAEAVRQLEEVCKHNAVVCRLLANEALLNAHKTITFDYSVHVIFPKLRIV